MRKRGSVGFTLIEVMIVVAIVAILAAFAYPAYQNQVQDSRRSDGQSALTQAAQRLERCYTADQDYTDGGGNACTTLGTSDEGYYNITADSISRDSFTLHAEPTNGGPQEDDRCGTLTLDNQGNKGSTVTGANDCW
ncbi:MAG: type IV pilin protein [Ectothiorhodospiraceae bacterium]